MTRRNFLKTALLITTAPASLVPAVSSYAGFKMGLQSFVLRQIPFDSSLDVVHGLGLHFLETFEGHLSQYSPPDRLKEVGAELYSREIKLMAYGVVGFDVGAPNRTITTFDFAKKMGVYAISANPEPGTFNLLEKLIEQYQINVAIHPHGPDPRGPAYDRYPGWKSVAEVVRGKHPRIGLCLDIGHISRNGENAVEGIYALSSRVYDVHLKDVDRLGPKCRDTVIGQGIINFPSVFRALKDTHYKGMISIECEMDEYHPLPDIQGSLRYLRQILN